MVKLLCCNTGGQPGIIIYTWTFVIYISTLVEPKVIQIHWDPKDTVFQVSFSLKLQTKQNKLLEAQFLSN